jgi:hypothetical protein
MEEGNGREVRFYRSPGKTTEDEERRRRGGLGDDAKQIRDFNPGNRRTTTMRPSGHQQVWTFLERMWVRSDLRPFGPQEPRATPDP